MWVVKAKKRKRKLPENAKDMVRFIVSSSKECQTLEEKACDFFESYNINIDGIAYQSIYFEHSCTDSVAIRPIKKHTTISGICYHGRNDGGMGEVYNATPDRIGMMLNGINYTIEFKLKE